MANPPGYLMPVLHSIETTVLSVWNEFPQLKDKDVEFVYDQLKTYYKKRLQGKEIDEPISTIARNQALIDEILNFIDVREEMEADLGLINNPAIMPDGRPILDLSALYVYAFNTLTNSVRLWRKNTSGGYLKFIKENVL